MKPECIAAVGAVLGHAPSEAELRNVEDRLARAMRQEAARDTQAWLALPVHEQVKRGAIAAADELRQEAALKQQRAVLQVIATARVTKALGAIPGTPFEGLARLLAFHADRKAPVISLESRTRAIHNDALRQMLTTLEATHPKFFGLFEDVKGLHDLVRELHGEATGNPDAKAGAQAFHDVTEALRQRFNRAGGSIGKLEDWGMPHHHSQAKVATAGGSKDPAANRQAWIAKVMPLLDRAKYVIDSGKRMTDAELVKFLGEAWSSIATGGINKLEPGQFSGSGMTANHGSASRQIHFKNADAYLAYQREFGERTPYDVMLGHIGSLAKDVALVEMLGPNPDHTFRLFRDRALKTMVEADPTQHGKAIEQAKAAESLYAMVAGKTQPIANANVARFFDGLRNLMVASKLGSAFLTAITDEGTMRVAAHVANVPQMRMLRNELATLNPLNRQEERLALRAGLAMNTLAHSLNRWGNEGLGSGWSAKLANATLRASGLSAITEARKRAYGVTMMDALGAVVREHAGLADLDAHDHRLLLSKGVTAKDWAVWRLADLEQWPGGNKTMLTPDAIYRIPDAKLAGLGDPRTLKEQAVVRLLGHVLEETDVAVIEPGARERAFMRDGLTRGELRGELTRSFFLFKSFPIAMVTRHWARALAEPSVMGRAGYMAALVASTTVLGMVALQAQQVVMGKDPRDMTKWKTWVQALLRGGAFSVYGDFLLADETEGGQSILATTAGPIAGLVEDVTKLTVGNLHRMAEGKQTHAGAEAIKLLHDNLPGANLWYTKAVIDHLIFHQLQEYLSPGYLRKMRARARSQYQQRYWWEPGATAPKRAPDAKAAIGGH